MSGGHSQRDRAIQLLTERGMARASELREAGITAATISRMEHEGAILRLDRGLYQLPDAELEANHSLAEAAKCVPGGVICLTSALAYHELTDQLPRKVWIAIEKSTWQPEGTSLPLRIVRMTDRLLSKDVETHIIEGVRVKVFGVAKTLADCFRYKNKIGQSVALEGLQEALRQRKATPAEIARAAEFGRVSTVMRPYLEALTANG